MTRSGGTIGLCLLILGLIGAQTSTAATKGTTAFTCTESAPVKQFNSEHCVPSGTGTQYGHLAIPENTPTEFKVTNAKTNATTTESTRVVLKETIAATNLELTATGVEGTGTVENRKAASGEHYVTWTSSTIYTGVTVTAPAGKGCKVFEDVQATNTEGAEGVIKTLPLKGTTQGQGDLGKVEPATGSTFATFFLTCTKGLGIPEALEGTWTFTGSVTCPTNGATVICRHEEITTQNQLKGKGAKAGLDVATTVSGRPNAGQPFTPLSVTTVETP